MQSKTISPIFLFIVFLTLGCTSSKNKSHGAVFLNKQINTLPLQKKLKLEKASREITQSWIPEHGIRAKYEVLKNKLGISMLEKALGEKVFVKGPHTNEMNYKTHKSFGWYNPKFLAVLKVELKKLFKNKLFRKQTQTFYEKNFKFYMRMYYHAYIETLDKQEILEQYKKRMDLPDKLYKSYRNRPGNYINESFRYFAESWEYEGFSVYEGFTTPGFWIRRQIDGTHKDFYKLLVLTLKHYDPVFIEQQNIKT